MSDGVTRVDSKERIKRDTVQPKVADALDPRFRMSYGYSYLEVNKNLQ
jgi:hypothetical protein